MIYFPDGKHDILCLRHNIPENAPRFDYHADRRSRNMPAVPAYFMRPVRQRLPWAILSGAFGLLFGLLCIPVYAAVGGWHMVFSTWISGIPYDLVHGVSNFLIALVAFVPLRDLLEKLSARRIRP